MNDNSLSIVVTPSKPDSEVWSSQHTHPIYKPLYEILYALTLLYTTTDRNRLKYENKPQPYITMYQIPTNLTYN